MAGYKRPRAIRIVEPDALPRTPTGKVLHRVLRERMALETSGTSSAG